MADQPLASFFDDLRRKERFNIVRGEDVGGHDFQKEEVNYRYASSPEQSCGVCANFNEDGTCRIVTGLIRPVDTCDKWEATGTSLSEEAPPGWEGTVKAMKKHPEIDNPWALAHYLKNQGATSHIRATEVVDCACPSCKAARDTAGFGMASP